MIGHLCLVVPLLLPLQAEGFPTKAAGNLVGPWPWCEGWSVSEQNSDIPNDKLVRAVPVSALNSIICHCNVHRTEPTRDYTAVRSPTDMCV